MRTRSVVHSKKNHKWNKYHHWEVSQRSHGVWDTPASLTCCWIKSCKYIQLNKIFIYSSNIFIVKRKPQTIDRSRSRSNFQRTTQSHLRSSCWSVRHPCDRWGLRRCVARSQCVSLHRERHSSYLSCTTVVWHIALTLDRKSGVIVTPVAFQSMEFLWIEIWNFEIWFRLKQSSITLSFGKRTFIHNILFLIKKFKRFVCIKIVLVPMETSWHRAKQGVTLNPHVPCRVDTNMYLFFRQSSRTGYIHRLLKFWKRKKQQ